MPSITKRISNLILLFGVFTFLVMGTCGIFNARNMEKKVDGKMNGCLFNGVGRVCTMSFGEHLTQWQSMFAAIPSKTSALPLLIFGLILFAFGSVFKNHFLWAQERLWVIQKLYLFHNQSIFVFNPLREAFSQGILNPKIY